MTQKFYRKKNRKQIDNYSELATVKVRLHCQTLDLESLFDMEKYWTRFVIEAQVGT